MNTIYKFILILSVAALHISCEHEVILDLKSAEPRLVIDAAISENLPCEVKLTLTQSFYDNEPYKRISGATVILTDNEGNYEVLKEEYWNPGLYKSQILGTVGIKYYLKVIVDGETYEANAVIPEVVHLEEIYLYEIKAGDKSWYSPSVIFNDPADVVNYYYTIVTVNERVLQTLYLHDDEHRNGKPVHRILFFDKEENGDEELQTGDYVEVEMQTIDYGMYEFYRSWSSFAGGDSNPTTNFTGDVLGCFKAYNSSVIGMTVSADRIYKENN